MGLGLASVRYKGTCEGLSEKKECRKASVTGALSELDNGHIREKKQKLLLPQRVSLKRTSEAAL